MTESPANNEEESKPAEAPTLGSRVAWPVRRAWWAVQEGIIWRASDVGRALADDARWPFERIGWGIRRYVAWPASDFYAERGALGRSSIAATLLIAGGAAAFGGVQLADSGNPAPSMRQVAAVTGAASNDLERRPMLIPAEIPEPAETGPVLQGVAPTFEPVSNENSNGGAADDEAPETDSTGSSDAVADDATAENAPDPDTVREPLAVARRFAAAFVAYEIGEGVAEARTTFRETASPALARALVDRPPRQPASVEVPKAKVLNLVPGPRQDKMLPVSVSLLRLGATSELRLDLERTEEGDWLVGDVRG
jgi:hypothetical protein